MHDCPQCALCGERISWLPGALLSLLWLGLQQAWEVSGKNFLVGQHVARMEAWQLAQGKCQFPPSWGEHEESQFLS